MTTGRSDRGSHSPRRVAYWRRPALKVRGKREDGMADRRKVWSIVWQVLVGLAAAGLLILGLLVASGRAQADGLRADASALQGIQEVTVSLPV
jgi:hypothetical protein